MSIKLPLWLRAVLLVGAVILATGGGLFAYRYFTRPTTLTVAVGSIDGEAAKLMSAMANQFALTGAPVRLNVIDSGTTLGAAEAFSANKVDLAVVRGDVGDLSQAQAVVVVSHMVVLVIAPPGSSIDSTDKLKGQTIGVVGGVHLGPNPDFLLGGRTSASAECRHWSGRAVRWSSCAILLSLATGDARARPAANRRRPSATRSSRLVHESPATWDRMSSANCLVCSSRTLA